MAYRISQPLAATQFNDDKPKKGRKKDAYGDTSEYWTAFWGYYGDDPNYDKKVTI